MQLSLHKAISNADEAAVTKLIDAVADLEALDEGGWTPLHNAAAKGFDSIIQKLLAAGAKVDSEIQHHNSKPRSLVLGCYLLRCMWLPLLDKL